MESHGAGSIPARVSSCGISCNAKLDVSLIKLSIGNVSINGGAEMTVKNRNHIKGSRLIITIVRMIISFAMAVFLVGTPVTKKNYLIS